jgi:Anti-sigma factor NepR
MTTYPLDFHRRFEQKWALRAQPSSARDRTPRPALVSSSQHGLCRSGQSECRDILARRPWLREMGQWLRAEYNATVDQPVPERLAALLKELKGRRH